MKNPVAIIKDFRVIIGFALFVLLILAGIYFAGKQAGKKKNSKRVQVPEDLDGDAGGYYDPGILTDAFYADIYSPAFSFRNLKPYKDFLALSNSKAAIVINDWKDRYYKEDQETLYEAIAGETKGWGTDPYVWAALREAVLRKIKDIEQIQ